MSQKIDLKTLERLCPEAASEYEMYGRYDFESALMVNPKNIKAIAACIVELARHLREAYCSLYGVKDGNKLFEGLINGMNMATRKERDEKEA